MLEIIFPTVYNFIAVQKSLKKVKCPHNFCTMFNMAHKVTQVLTIEFKARRTKGKSLTFPRQAKVKPIFPSQNAPRTRRHYDDGQYLVDPLFSRTAFFEILDFSFNPAFVKKTRAGVLDGKLSSFISHPKVSTLAHSGL